MKYNDSKIKTEQEKMMFRHTVANSGSLDGTSSDMQEELDLTANTADQDFNQDFSEKVRKRSIQARIKEIPFIVKILTPVAISILGFILITIYSHNADIRVLETQIEYISKDVEDISVELSDSENDYESLIDNINDLKLKLSIIEIQVNEIGKLNLTTTLAEIKAKLDNITDMD